MHCGASLVTVGVVCDLMCSAQRKVDELDVCEFKACSCTIVHRIVTELSPVKRNRKNPDIKWKME